MRRTAVTVMLLLVATLLPAGAATADPKGPGPLPDQASAQATAALTAVKEALAGKGKADPKGLSTLLLDLEMASADLTPEQQLEAERLTPRVDGGGGSATVNGRQKTTLEGLCSGAVCVWRFDDQDHPHHSTLAYAEQALLEANKVLNRADAMNYRAPRVVSSDRVHSDPFVTNWPIAGGRLNIALVNLGANGYYGYCTPVQGTVTRRHGTAPAFCAIDNDMAEFTLQTPLNNVRVTLAHELFHAVQYAYDYGADKWLMEATATWFEERFAPDVKDNRQFLPLGQAARPLKPLDRFGPQSYGNWAFFEFLSQKHGNGVVRQVWNQTAQGRHSIRALQRVLNRGKRGGLARNYAHFGSVNRRPRSFYADHGTFPTAPVQATRRMAARTQKSRNARYSTKVNQLTSKTAVFNIRRKGINSRKWRLVVNVSGPARATNPGAHALIVMRNGNIRHRQINLNRFGNGRVAIGMRRGKVARVFVTVANGSSRFTCDRGTLRACQGRPRDNGKAFAVHAQLRR
ncbi:MXAN_6640 family putative metalloprotease [Nocardioides limicola]|uniref:MXAN_6640 family putative metalloprotease n=1 Tax=Nocardioides limicola TaxID=2803368 RepID=UPI00193C63B7|nr:MXAN_6640 family putative metalloprotease [Nocardioides sp. DJM-14]